MDRRSFLKALGLGGGATALTGCGIDNNRYYTPVEEVLPYIVRPEQVTPGTNSFFATTVGTGPSAYPAAAVHRDGRVINVAANTAAPMPTAVSSSSLFELQKHFSPDRVTAPSKGGAPVEWSAAIDELAGAAKQARAAGKAIVYVGPPTTGALGSLLDAFTGGRTVHLDTLGRDAESRAAQALFGSVGLPSYDLSKAHFVLSFGAPFLSDAWGSSATQADYASARDAEQGHFVARYASVTPIKDQTAANADDWYACKPGSEAAVCLAVAKLVAAKKGARGKAASLVAKGDPAAAAAASGLAESDIEQLAEWFAAGHAVALPGGAIGASMAATQLAAASYLLNLVAGSKGDTFLPGGYQGPLHGASEIDQLVADMEAGKVGVLLLGDVDPVYALPGGEAFAAAMAKVGTTVAVTSHPNETTSKAAMVLPTHSVFEDWGVEEPVAGLHLVRQPGQVPLHDTMALGDILVACQRKAGVEAPASWREAVHGYLAAAVYEPVVLGKTAPVEGEEAAPAAPAEGAEGEAEAQPTIQTAAFARWFEGVLAAGFVKGAAGGSLAVSGTFDFGAAAEPPGSGDMTLVAFPHAFLLDGRYANQPWAQEMPDPLSGQVWDTWALLHPSTAAKLGVQDNDAVTVSAGGASLTLGVEISPTVRPDVVAVPMGGGHTAASGRYAEAIGQSVATALPKSTDASGTIVWQAKCSVTKAGGKADLISTFGGDHDRDRGFVALCEADAYAKQGDKAVAHPGDLTGIHHLELDARLRERDIEGFYPIPDHPTYRFGLTVDTNKCTGCGACSVACYAENNLPVVGKDKVKEGREMSWIRINRYLKDGGSQDHGVEGGKSVHFTPMMCQQCNHAPCESVCPVLATYHTIDGLNAMVYNRCAGTRYCSNACPYSARKFNYHTYVWPEPFNLQLNPDVATRTMGVMEKCTFCVQRIRRTKSAYRDQGFRKTVPAEALSQLTACAEACPSQALTFGNIIDEASAPHFTRKSGRNFYPIADIHTYPAVNYLAKASFHFSPGHHGEEGEHAEGGDHGGGHEADAHGAEKHEPAHDAHGAH